MKTTVARYLDGMRTTFDGSYVSTLIKPKQVFVNAVVAYDATEDVNNRILDIHKTLPAVNAFTLTQGPDSSTAISAIISASDNEGVERIYIRAC